MGYSPGVTESWTWLSNLTLRAEGRLWRVCFGNVSNLHFNKNTPAIFLASVNPASPSLTALWLG